MNKLSEMVQMLPRRSGIAMTCEVVPGHSDTKFGELLINKTVMVTIDGTQRAISAKISMRVCQSCLQQFVYDMTKVSQELFKD